MTLVQLPDGTWAEQAPQDCPQCSLAWPWDGTPDRVLQGHVIGGGRSYQCCGCGHITLVRGPDFGPEWAQNAKKGPAATR